MLDLVSLPGRTCVALSKIGWVAYTDVIRAPGSLASVGRYIDHSDFTQNALMLTFFPITISYYMAQWGIEYVPKISPAYTAAKTNIPAADNKTVGAFKQARVKTTAAYHATVAAFKQARDTTKSAAATSVAGLKYIGKKVKGVLWIYWGPPK